jgi:hypothetical protein
MYKLGKKKSPLELADLILQHNPGASIDMIADIISEWGDLLDDRRFGAHTSIDIVRVGSNRQPQMRSMNIKFTQPLTRVNH